MSTIAPLKSRYFGATAPHISAATSDRDPGIARRLRSFLAIAGAVALVACGGGGAGGNNSAAAHVVRGRVALGGLGGSTVSMYRVGEYGDPVATTTSSIGETTAEIGRFTFPLPATPSDTLFLFVVSGGAARDVDEDGVLDGPTGSLGTIHALATAAQLEQQEIRISAVTEVVYQRALYFLRARYDEEYLARVCDSWAGFVLRTNLAGGAGIGNEDALAFDPLLHGAATYRPYVPHFRDFVFDVLDGQPLIEPAFALSREQIHFEDFGGPAYGVALVGNIAYQCKGAGGLEIRSVADPTHAPLLYIVGTPGVAKEVQVVGDLAYVADGTGVLCIDDVSDPVGPVGVAAVPLAGPVVSVHVVGNRAYLCSDGATPMLHIVDVTVPLAPTVLSETPLAAAGTTVRVVGDFAYVLEDRKIETFSVANPALPVSQGTFATQASAHIDVGPGHLFLADDTHFETFSLAAPATPLSIATLPLQGYGSDGLRVRGTRALAMRGDNGVELVDVSDPAQPSFLGVVATSGSAVDADVDAGLCVVSDGSGGLSIVGAGTPPPSAVVASVPWTNGLDSVYAVGNRVYASTNRPTQFVVFDTTNPLAPVQIGSVDLATAMGRQIAVFGDVAFVAENGGLHAYSLADPAAPVHLSGAASATAVYGVAAGPGVAYAVRGEGVDVFDVSDPTNLALITTLPLAGGGQRIAFDGSTLAVAASLQGLLLYDTTTPTDPKHQSTVPISSAIYVLLRPPLAFVSQYTASTLSPKALRIVDYSILSAPAIVRTLALPGMVDRLSRWGDRVYATAGVAGVNVVDVTLPGAAVHVANIPVPANIRDIAANDGWVYIADGFPDGALKVVRGDQTDVP